MKRKLSFALLFLMLLAVLSPRAARADLGYWSAALVGSWRHPTTGDVYRFNSNATYTWTRAKATVESVIGSSGYWKIVQPTAKESGGSQEGPVALILKQRKIVFENENSGKRYSSNLKMDSRLVVNTVIVNDAENRNLFRIEGANWKRVK